MVEATPAGPVRNHDEPVPAAADGRVPGSGHGERTDRHPPGRGGGRIPERRDRPLVVDLEFDLAETDGTGEGLGSRRCEGEDENGQAPRQSQLRRASRVAGLRSWRTRIAASAGIALANQRQHLADLAGQSAEPPLVEQQAVALPPQHALGENARFADAGRIPAHGPDRRAPAGRRQRQACRAGQSQRIAGGETAISVGHGSIHHITGTPRSRAQERAAGRGSGGP